MMHVVVVHGALGSARQMQPVADALRGVASVTAPELPGHGDTVLPTGHTFTIDTFVRALRTHVVELAAAAADAADADRAAPIAFGYSMGGYVALALEAAHPGTFSRIVTLGTKFEWTPDVASREASRLNAAMIAEKVPKFATLLQERHAGAGGWEMLLQRTALLLHALGASPTLNREALARIAIPVTVAVGERDDTVSLDEATRIAAMIPSAQSAAVVGAPHPIERVALADLCSLITCERC